MKRRGKIHRLWAPEHALPPCEWAESVRESGRGTYQPRSTAAKTGHLKSAECGQIQSDLTLLLVANEEALTGIYFADGGSRAGIDGDWKEQPTHPVLQTAKRQLDEYFAGRRKTFDLPLAPSGTPFQHRVWQALRAIPYGETQSYAAIARRIGNPKAVRAGRQ